MADPYPTWLYKGTWEITANHPGTGYQVCFTVPFYTGMAESPKDYRDIRFSDASDNTLYYWIESYSDTEAKVWVKLASSDTNGTLHYGNSGASDASDGTNTFELYDSFENTTILTGSTGTPTLSYVTGFGGVGYAIQVDGGNSAHVEIQSTVSIARGNIFEANLKIPASVTNPSLGGIGFGLTAGSNTGYQALTDSTSGSTSSTADMQIRVNASSSAIVDYEYGDIQKDVWYKIQVKWLSTGVINYNLYDGDTLFGNASGTPGTVYTTGVCGLHSYSKTIFDNFRVRKYIATEPTISVAEDANQVPVANFSATPLTGYIPLTVQFTDASTGTPTSWEWDFGDGSTHSTDQNPSHEYRALDNFTVALTATNATGSDTETKTDYINVTLEEATNTIIYVRVSEMDHKVGTTQKHPLQIAASDGSGFLSEITGASITAFLDGVACTGNPQSWTISSFDANANCFWLEIPSTAEGAASQNLLVNVTCNEGSGSMFLNIVPDYSTIPTTTELGNVGSNVTAIKAITDLLTADPLGAINAEIDTAISDAALATAAGLSALPAAFLDATIRSGRSVSQVLRIIEIMLDGSVTGLTSGSGSPVTFTGADGSTVTFTVDANGNRAISSVNLV